MDSTIKRDYSLDLLKCIAMYFVIFYHNFFSNYDFINNASMVTYTTYFMRTILSTCVPIFFFVNGALLLNKEIVIKKHTIKTIKIIFITGVYGIIALILLMFIKQEYFTFKQFLVALWSWKLGWINPLWFLQALVVIYLFFPVIKSSFDSANKSFHFFLCVVLITTFGNEFLLLLANSLEFVLGINYFGDSFNFFNQFNPLKGIYGYAIGYFMIGGLIYKYRIKFCLQLNITCSIVVIISSMFFATVYGVIISISSNEIYDVVWNGYDSIFTLLCVLAFFCLSSLYYKGNHFQKVVSLISQNTLGIYFLHIIIDEIFKPFYLNLSNYNNIFVNSIYALIILFSSLAIVIFLKKIPFIKLLFLL